MTFELWCNGRLFRRFPALRENVTLENMIAIAAHLGSLPPARWIVTIVDDNVSTIVATRRN